MQRRTFLAGLAGCLVAPRLARAGADGDAGRLETFLDWQQASPAARERALASLADRIRELDAPIHAWVQIAPQPATAAGPLQSIPFGAKDIIETRGLATEYGSSIYNGRIGTTDAAIVRDLRARGAVLMGKTHTTAFAYRTPAPTRNPRDLAYTPGGSSSGSAAAVAAGMVPFAIGTQTGGSVLRPASFCGVTGFKPTYGSLPMEGVLPFAKSLDTLGFFTHTAADMIALWEASGHGVGGDQEAAIAAVDPLPASVEPPMAAAFTQSIARLRSAGIGVTSIDLRPPLDELIAANRTIMFYEGARFHEQRYKEYGDRLEHMATLVREGLQIPTSTYDATRRRVQRLRSQLDGVFRKTPIVLVPAAIGPAPLGLESTGDSSMNAPWTTLGTPAISIPMPVGSALPLGLQLTAAHADEARLLRTAVRVEAVLRARSDRTGGHQ